METSRLKKFAQHARRALLDQVGTQLDRVLQPGSLAQRESEAAVKDLKEQINSSSREQVIEQVAYTWFNRFCALRFMDVNRYTRIGTVSPAEGFSQPEILAEAKQGHIDEELPVDRQEVFELLDGTRKSDDPQQEAYRLLLVAVCNQYHDLMPFMFEEIKDYTELLLPEDLLSEHSILADLRETLTQDSCEDVEVIGWLYQFYISEKKDDVFAALKRGKKITPENIPAATQLFTPHWIVRYLVENSLGRLWMLNHPESRLIDQMDYYIKPEEPETDFLQISSPEEVKVCDPACGSGHMLTYAFDLLYAIYEEQGYQATDIPRLILTHNLYGIEIDQRAGALAAFALTMKARQKYRRFLQPGKVVQPNICVLENIHVDPEDLNAYMEKVGRDLFTGGIQSVVHDFEEADNFGSLIRPSVTDVSDVLEILRERKLGNDLFLADVHQKVLQALRQADYLSPKYHVVVANPPYMGSRNMGGDLKKFCGKEYPTSKADLFATFISRSEELVQFKGLFGMVTMQSWMFLSSFEDFRAELLAERTLLTMAHLGERAFDTIGGAVVSTTAFVASSNHISNYPTRYVRLTSGQNELEKRTQLLDDPSVRFTCSSEQLRKIDGQPIAYWISKNMRAAFVDGVPLSDFAEMQPGLQTSDNKQFVRLWHEVSLNRISFDSTSNEESIQSGCKWFPYNKGGEFRKWYGNNEHVVNWENDGQAIKSFVTEKYPYLNGNIDYVVKDRGRYFRESITWTFIGSGAFGVRKSDPGFLFDVAGSSAFPNSDDLYWITGFLCTKQVFNFLMAMNPTLNFQVGNVESLPVLQESVHRFRIEVTPVAQRLVELHTSDWNSSECSWDFSGFLWAGENDLLSESYQQVTDNWEQAVSEVATLESLSNRVFISEYGLDAELDSEIPLDDITLWCNPRYRYGSDKSESELEALLLADTMREFISYAVGCMLGRYSLDKPGLILANQGETLEDYLAKVEKPLDELQFAPDEDNVIPLLDGDWFTDDISERFKEFLKVTFGTEHYEENLTFLENALYPENATARKRKTIRDYFLKEFYNHHIKLYKKRPIYWLFSSSKGTFNALIYMHRYRPDTVSVVLNDYLREFQKKLRAEIEHLENVADSESVAQTEKTKALKQLTQYRKDLKELEEYEQKILYPLAVERIEIDLDDGVKVNYNKFGKALKKVTGLTQ